METELLRTFLEVNRLRSFARAAENLSLTPSAVSARIRQLESGVRRSLFKRNSREVQLTAAGDRLLRHAVGILEAWEQAERDLALRDRRQVTIAGVAGFWDVFIQQWLNRVRAALPDISPWVEVSTAVRVAEKLAQGEIHLGFLYDPPRLADLLLREVHRERLILVASCPDLGVEQALTEDYVFVDWGTAFTNQHNRCFPHRPPAAARSNSGRVALELIRASGGSAYLPSVLVRRDIEEGGLHEVPQAPSFEMRVYAAYVAHGPQSQTVEQMLAHAAGEIW